MKRLNLATIKAIKRNFENKGYVPSKWIFFSERMIRENLEVHVYESKTTLSKYVHVSNGEKTFKVRFSNHRPNKHKEDNGDCNFFVGVTNKHIANTDHAIAATLRFFGKNVAAPSKPKKIGVPKKEKTSVGCFDWLKDIFFND